MYYHGLIVQPDCHLCPLQRDKKVLPDGPISSSFCIVGEGPGCVLPHQYVSVSGGSPTPIKDMSILPYQVQFRQVREYIGAIFEVTALGHSAFLTREQEVKVRPSLVPLGKGHLRRRLDKEQWVEAQDLRKDMFLIIPKQKLENVHGSTILDLKSFEVNRKCYQNAKTNIIPINKTVAIILGLFLGDGNAAEKGGTVSWYLSKGYKEKYVKLITKWLRYLQIPHNIKRQGKNIAIKVYSTKLAKYLGYHFYSTIQGKRGHGETKRIPSFVWLWPKQLISNFLFGWHEADGKHLKNLSRPKMISTVSREALLGGVDLLCKLGVLPSIRKNLPKGKGKQIYYDLALGNSLARKLEWPLSYHSLKSRILYQEDDENYYVPISKIVETEYKGLVYDLTTTQGSFQVPFTIHNSVETREGKGFVGPSGQLLWKMCTAYKISREDIWLSNAALCQPRGVKLSTGGFLNKTLVTGMSVRACRRRLIGELYTVTQNNPNAVIMPLGNHALWSLTQRKKAKIMSYRGSLMSIDLAHEWGKLVGFQCGG